MGSEEMNERIRDKATRQRLIPKSLQRARDEEKPKQSTVSAAIRKAAGKDKGGS